MLPHSITLNAVKPGSGGEKKKKKKKMLKENEICLSS